MVDCGDVTDRTECHYRFHVKEHYLKHGLTQHNGLQSGSFQVFKYTPVTGLECKAAKEFDFMWFPRGPKNVTYLANTPYNSEDGKSGTLKFDGSNNFYINKFRIQFISDVSDSDVPPASLDYTIERFGVTDYLNHDLVITNQSMKSYLLS